MDNSERFDVRLVKDKTGKFDFGIVAADMAAILGIQRVSHLTSAIAKEWKSKIAVLTDNGTRTVCVIWAPGIYSYLSKSRRPEAQSFQAWLVREVAPMAREQDSFWDEEDGQEQCPDRDTIEYVEAAAQIEELENDRVRDLLTEMLIDELQANRRGHQPVNKVCHEAYVMFRKRALELGYSPEAIEEGNGFTEFVQDYIGSVLDTAIHTFFGA